MHSGLDAEASTHLNKQNKREDRGSSRALLKGSFAGSRALLPGSFDGSRALLQGSFAGSRALWLMAAEKVHISISRTREKTEAAAERQRDTKGERGRW